MLGFLFIPRTPFSSANPTHKGDLNWLKKFSTRQIIPPASPSPRLTNKVFKRHCGNWAREKALAIIRNLNFSFPFFRLGWSLPLWLTNKVGNEN